MFSASHLLIFLCILLPAAHNNAIATAAPRDPKQPQIMRQYTELLPDQRVLSGIFPGISITEGRCKIISNTYDTCTFYLVLEKEPRSGFPKDLLIRLEPAGSNLLVVAELQRLANLQLRDLVPATLGKGTTTDKHGRQLEYSITPFLDGTTVLEEIWGRLGQGNQRSLMESIVDAMVKLQSLAIDSPDVRQVIKRHDVTSQNNSSSDKSLMGCPDIGFHSDIKQLLEAFLGPRAARLPACEITDTSEGIIVRSAWDRIGTIELSQSDLNSLMEHTVFCHNDLEPRNILVKRAGNAEWYELAAIIDWELAGFFPFAYEFGIKDALLGSSNLWFSWYSLFKEQTARLLPKEEGHEKLIAAVRIIAQSKDAMRPKNVGVRVRAKWMQRERLRWSISAREGWVREDGFNDLPAFTKEDNARLEREVLEELGYV